MTSNVFLNKILSKFCLPVFGGVYSNNNIPPVSTLRGKSIVVNTAPHSIRFCQICDKEHDSRENN